MDRPVVGLLVMAFGTPNRREEILPYYTHIRRGRRPTPDLLADLTRRYDAIGGLSQLNRISRAQAERLHEALQAAEPGIDWRLYVANKHWEPFIPDVVRQMAADGVRRAVGVVLSPQNSRLSTGAYFEQVNKVLAELPDPPEVIPVKSWHLEPDFIALQAELVRKGISRFPDGMPELLFTCHSLPERILAWNDPYPVQLREMGEAIAEQLGLKRIHFAYQSAGRTPEPWLGPDVRSRVRELAKSGVRAVLVAAVGFVADCLETLYDLDIELKQDADQLGIHLERTEMPNDHPLLARALAGAVRRALQGAKSA